MKTLIQVTTAGYDDAYRKVQIALGKAGLSPRRGYSFDPSVGKCGAFVSADPAVIAAFGAKHAPVDEGTSDDAA